MLLGLILGAPRKDSLARSALYHGKDTPFATTKQVKCFSLWKSSRPASITPARSKQNVLATTHVDFSLLVHRNQPKSTECLVLIGKHVIGSNCQACDEEEDKQPRYDNQWNVILQKLQIPQRHKYRQRCIEDLIRSLRKK
ncbi:hypothetical protein SUGI_0584050 [Cryptomeria japonica]|nr:hypothetical protein SUGI_0584050 [Cryptomeria japonica]